MTYTYGELDSHAELIAKLLIDRGIRPGDRVGLHLPASPLWIAAMLAVVKCGAAYVPLDPSTPQDRRQFICNDANLAILLGEPLSDDADSERRAFLHVPTAELARERLRIKAPPGIQLPVTADPDGVAYVIYTSGTTGRPKGVPITHHNLLALFRATEDCFAFNEDDVWLLFHSVAFDFSVWEVWGCLLRGGRLHVPNALDSRQPRRTAELIQRERITVLNQTPSAYRALQPLLIQASSDPSLMSLRYIIFGGEALDPLEVRASVSALPSTRLVNMYGITETTVHATAHQLMDATGEPSPHSPIGKPLPGFMIEVVDEHCQPVPAGEIGELLLAGPQVSTGYLNRPELTEERFTLLNLDGTPRRYYRSGDLVRRCPDGLRYIGRNDHQVQLRGHRVELGEVETVMRRLQEVDAAIAVVHTIGVGDDRLICVYSSEQGQAISADALRRHARQYLPIYMQPSHYVWVHHIPRTENGKTDRTKSALIAKEYLDAQSSRTATS